MSRGHDKYEAAKARWEERRRNDPNWPLCKCGCGELAPYAKRGYPERGISGGEPLDYVQNHVQRNWRGKHRPVLIDPSTLCWLWTAGTTGDGYGRISVNRRNRPAHQVFWERRHGPMPVGMEIDHLCRTPACVNPDHLEPVSRAENCRRGRTTKLAPGDVEAIRAASTTAGLAARFGVTPRHIRKIRQGLTWREA